MQVLDRNGVCCAPERLDTCHVCNGSSTALDIGGNCGGRALDAAGHLCDNALDECGVCGGTGMSCSMHAGVSAALVYHHAKQGGPGTLAALQQQMLLEKAVSHTQQLIATELRLPLDAVLLNVSAGEWAGAKLPDRSLSVTPLSVVLHFAPLALPPESHSLASLPWLRSRLDAMSSRASLSLGDDAASLAEKRTWHGLNAAAVGAGLGDSDAVEVLVSHVVDLGREGVCGNGVCEVGELLPIDGGGGDRHALQAGLPAGGVRVPARGGRLRVLWCDPAILR